MITASATPMAMAILFDVRARDGAGAIVQINSEGIVGIVGAIGENSRVRHG